MTTPFALFDHVTQPAGTDLGQLYDQRFAMVSRAEAAGLHGYYVAEHHGHTLTMAPSQLTWLAALARETSSIRLGTMVSCLPLHNPLRLTEEIVMVDHLSQGRFDLGVGRGISPFEQVFVGNDPAQTKEIYDEMLPMIIRGAETGIVDGAGTKHFAHLEARLEMSSYQKPLMPVWAPGGIAKAAGNGFNAILPGPVTHEKRDEFDDAFQRGLTDPDRLHPARTKPMLASSQFVFVADSDEEARRIGVRAIDALNRLMRISSQDIAPHRLGELPPVPPQLAEVFSAEGTLRSGGALVGSPDTIRSHFQEQAELGLADLFVVHLSFGDLSLEEIDRSSRLFLDEVAPSFDRRIAEAVGR